MGTRCNQVFDGDDFDPNIIQNYLGSSFYHMGKYGERVYRPFMQARAPTCILCSSSSAAYLSTVITSRTKNNSVRRECLKWALFYAMQPLCCLGCCWIPYLSISQQLPTVNITASDANCIMQCSTKVICCNGTTGLLAVELPVKGGRGPDNERAWAAGAHDSVHALP